MGLRFDNQVVWITGGGTGMGREMALDFARRGADVAVTGRRAEKLAEVVAAIEAIGRKALAAPGDVTDDAGMAQAVAQIVARFGRLDVAVANAGYGVVGTVAELTDEIWRRQFDINFFGALNAARHALPELRKTRGRLAFVGSVMSFLTLPKNGAYAASKFAIRAVSLTLSQELQGTGVTSTALYPGFVSTEIVNVDNAGGFHEDFEDRRPKALLWAADHAARVMVDAVARRKREFVFTGHGKFGAFVGKHFPGLIDRVGPKLGQ